MGLIPRYIALRLLGFWLFCLGSLFGLVLLSESLSDLNLLLAGLEAQLFLLRKVISMLPRSMEIMLPLSVLLAVRFTHNAFLRTHEWHTMQGAGLSLFRLYMAMWPILLFAGVLGHINQNHFGGWALSIKPHQVRDLQRHVWELGGTDAVYVRRVLPVEALLQDVLVLRGIVTPGGPFALDHFAELHQENGIWLANEQASAAERIESTNQGWRREAADLAEAPTEVLNTILSQRHISIHHLTFGALLQSMQQTYQKKLNTHHHWLELHQEFALLAAPFFLGWLALTVINPSPRQAGGTFDLMLVLIIGVIFVLGQEILWLLGQSNALNPLFAAWGMNGLVLLASILWRARLRNAS